MTKIFIILLLSVIILMLINIENFTGFRKVGIMTEFENDPDLFPYIPKSIFIKYKNRLRNLKGTLFPVVKFPN
jgi:hypothetical protein